MCVQNNIQGFKDSRVQATLFVKAFVNSTKFVPDYQCLVVNEKKESPIYATCVPSVLSTAYPKYY